MIILVAFVSSFQPLNLIFNVVRRQDLYVVAILIGMAVNGATLFWLVRDEIVLTAFPQALLAGRVVFMVACYLLLARLARRSTLPSR